MCPLLEAQTKYFLFHNKTHPSPWHGASGSNNTTERIIVPPSFISRTFGWCLQIFPHRDVDMWGRVWMSHFRRVWQNLNFDKEYLFGFETFVFATSGILSMRKQLVTLQIERKALIHLEVEFIRIICSWSELHRSRWMLLLASLGHTVVKHPYCWWVYSVAHMVKKTVQGGFFCCCWKFEMSSFSLPLSKFQLLTLSLSFFVSHRNESEGLHIANVR